MLYTNNPQPRWLPFKLATLHRTIHYQTNTTCTFEGTINNDKPIDKLSNSVNYGTEPTNYVCYQENRALLFAATGNILTNVNINELLLVILKTNIRYFNVS